MSAAEPSLGPDDSAPAPSPTVHPTWTPPRGGHIFQPPSPTGRPYPQVPLASHLGLHPLPTGTPRKQGQPRSRAPSGKRGARSQADPTCRVSRPQRPPPSLGTAWLGRASFWAQVLGEGMASAPGPFHGAPFTILDGSRPLPDQVENSPVGQEPGRGRGRIKDPTEACSPVVGNGRRTKSVLGRRGTAWRVVPPGNPSPLLGTRAEGSSETNGTKRDRSRQRRSWSKQGVPGRRVPTGGDPSEDKARQTRNTSSRWPDGLAQLQRPLGKRVQAKGKGDTPTVSALRADASAFGRVHALLLMPPWTSGWGRGERGGRHPRRGRPGCPAGTLLGRGGGIGHLDWLSSPELRPPAQAREEQEGRDQRVQPQGERKPV